ncbi:hypothetical protein H9Y04_32515 [Streptomyces sp. TRM66268-LWL]|uniref:CdiI immunity protein domain-containing protein n=1 Tax=Streptomyces polyasparticus TaxID=2767826 RepID=A0ABR7SP41_9ACTN|nr:hypothetical protein [Streptomyces polyasparticus]MBC9717261.1 hypothetical protein [Streptomyces polyasparticus]
MLSQESIEHFRFEGARVLLSGLGGHAPDSADRDSGFEAWEPGVRALWESSRRGGRSLYEVAAEFRLAADLLESGRPGLPADLARPDWLHPAADAPAAYRDIAEYVEQWPSGAFGRLQGKMPTSRELMYRFPSLGQLLLNYFGQDGEAAEEGMSEAEGLQLFIEQSHPYCLWSLPAIAAECAEALAIFHDEETLRSFFEEEHGMGSGELPWAEWIPLIGSTMTAHMRDQHPARWSR